MPLDALCNAQVMSQHNPLISGKTADVLVEGDDDAEVESVLHDQPRTPSEQVLALGLQQQHKKDKSIITLFDSSGFSLITIHAQAL